MTQQVNYPEISLKGVQIPASARFEQYLGEWLVEPARFAEILRNVADINLAAHVAKMGPLQDPEAAAYAMEAVGAQYDRARGFYMAPGGVAIINLEGTLTKYGSSFSTQGSLLAARDQVRRAGRDGDVRAIVLRIDSPGGTVSGTKDLADAVAEVAKTKPVTAFAEDLAASAAYWVGCQAGAFYANQTTASVGSIGVVTYLYDLSENARQNGIRAVVISSGEMKGMGVPGSAVTAGQEAYMQERVDELARQFNAAVGKGRGLAAGKVREVADGRVWLAAEAVKLGLIDGVKSFEQVVGGAGKTKVRGGGAKAAAAEAAGEEEEILTTDAHRCTQMEEEDHGQDARATSENPDAGGGDAGDDFSAVERPAEETTAETENDAMSGTEGGSKVTETPKAATAAQIEAACPGAGAEFVLGQIKAGATIEDAKGAFINALAAEKTAREAADAKLAEAGKKGTTGLNPNQARMGAGAGADTAGDGSAVEEFNAKVQTQMAQGKTRDAAINSVKAGNRDLFRRYLLETNPASAHALINQKFAA